MTPPFRFQNFLTGSVYASWAENDAPPRLSETAERQAVFAARDASEDSALAEAQSRFLLHHGAHYGSEILRPAHQRLTTEELEARLPGLLREARGGNRRAFFDALWMSYNLLDRRPSEGRPELLRQFLGMLQEYLNFLDNAADLGEMERLRYLFAASRVTQAALAWVQDHATEIVTSSSEDWPTLFEEAMRQTDARWRDHYGSLAAESPGDALAVTGISDEIELRGAILGGDLDSQRRWARRFESFYRDTPPAEDDPSWPAYQGRILLRDPEIFSSLLPFDRPSSAERDSLSLNALAGDLLLTAGAALDRIQGEDDAVVVERYRAFSVAFTALAWIFSDTPADEILEQLADPRLMADNLQVLAEARQRFPDLNRLWEEADTDAETAALMTEARQAAAHLLALREGIGRPLLEPILTATAHAHPIRRLALALNPPPAWAEALELPLPGSPMLSAHVAQARELFRGGPAAQEFLEARAESDPQARAVLQILRENDLGGPCLGSALEEIFSVYGGLLNDGADHEVAAAVAVLEAFRENRASYAQMGISAPMFQRADNLLARTEGFAFRARRVARHLLGGENLASVGIGVLISELFPTFLILRAGAGGRWAVRGLGDLVRFGRLTYAGSAVVGVTSGLALSATGSLLHNWQRRRLGLPTDTAGDALRGGLLNALTFGGTMVFSRWLGGALARRSYLRTGSYELSSLQSFGLHAGTVGAASLMALGGGIAWRWAETGRLYSTPEEWAENAGTVLMWETMAGAFRFGRRAIGVSLEMNGLHSETTGLGIGRTLWRGLGRVALTTLGPHRVMSSRGLALSMAQVNPQLAGSETRLAVDLAWRESGRPGTLETYYQALARGHHPVYLGMGTYRSAGWLQRGSFRFAEANATSTPPATTTTTTATAPYGTISGEPPSESAPPLPLEISDGEIAGEMPRLASPAASVEGALPSPATAATSTPLSAVETRPGGFPAADRHFFRVYLEETPGQGVSDAGYLVLNDPERGPAGEETYTVTRGHFDFLPPSVRRIISRRHFQIQKGPDGNWRIRDLSRSAPAGSETRTDLKTESFGTWLYSRSESGTAQKWVMLNPAEALPIRDRDVLILGRPDDGLNMEFRTPDAGAPPPPRTGENPADVSETLPLPVDVGFTRIALPPGGRHRLNGLVLVRDREHSMYRLTGPGGIRLEVARPQAEARSNRLRAFSATDNPEIGEIGESVLIRSESRSGERHEYRLTLDDPEGRGSRLPNVALEYGGQTWTRMFRASSPRLNFGKNYDSGFAAGGRQWISRQHFILELVDVLGQPRYRLTSQSRFGLRINGETMPQGAQTDLPSGTYRLEFLKQSNEEVYDHPASLTLPPLEIAFPEWGLQLLSNHDRAVLPPPPPASRTAVEESPALADRLEPETGDRSSTPTLRIVLDTRPVWRRFLDMFKFD